jgi:cell division protein FtsX
MDELMQTIFTVRRYVVTAMLVLSVSTVLVVVFVFLLSLRLRQGELQTLMRIGAGRGFIALITMAEFVAVTVTSIMLAVVLTWLTKQWGGEFMQLWLVS